MAALKPPMRAVAELPRWMAVPRAMSAIFISGQSKLLHYSAIPYSMFYSVPLYIGNILLEVSVFDYKFQTTMHYLSHIEQNSAHPLFLVQFPV